MNDENFGESGNESSTPSGSGSIGDQPPPFENPSPDEGKRPSSDDQKRMGKNLQRTGPIAGHSNREEADEVEVSHHSGKEEVHEGEIVTHGELTHILESFWSGPTPSPETLAQYKQIDPTFAERAFAMSEQSIAASNDEKVTLAHGDVDAIRRGQWLSAGLTAAFMALAIILYILSSDPWLSGLALAAPIFQYLGKFIRTVREDENDKIE